MKVAFVIMFALALVLSQPLAASVADTAPKSCCGCGVKKCCVSNSSKSSGEIPAVPAQASAQKSFQAILLLTIRGIPSIAATDDQIAASSFSPSVAGAVPLFNRDCAYLL